MPALPDVIRAAREQRRMTRGDLSLMAGVPLQRIRDIESGRLANPRIDDLLRVCGALGCKLGEIVSHPDREDDPWLLRTF